jgi:two-component system LytT family sensor kinase
VSKKVPLKILILAQGKSIVVINNLQVKQVQEESSQVGLKNIQSRYLFLTDEAVYIEKSESQFKVRIPLLEQEK